MSVGVGIWFEVSVEPFTLVVAVCKISFAGGEVLTLVVTVPGVASGVITLGVTEVAVRLGGGEGGGSATTGSGFRIVIGAVKVSVVCAKLNGANKSRPMIVS